MGFLSLFDGTEQVQVAPDYWVEIKKYLTSADYDAAKRALTTMTFTPGASKNDAGDMKPEPNVPEYERELVIASIVNWNLTDENGGNLPLSPENLKRASVKRLPEQVVTKIYARINELQKEEPTPREQATFPGGDSGSDSSGQRGPTDPTAVLHGAGDVAAVRHDEREPAEPPAA